MIFLKKKFQIKKTNFLITFNWLMIFMFHCSINLRSQSEPSGLRPDTSSLVVPTLDTTLCSGGLFFLQTNFHFLTSLF